MQEKDIIGEDTEKMGVDVAAVFVSVYISDHFISDVCIPFSGIIIY